ncbi:hypothetical protein HanHA300_Chr15g0562021 [Helianthus annuus]|nr:hypothetical protein HanHA300_Chr15g0562021 [Helianthus annuus]KAJ0648417.1 hypothetical protein HanLR1_Chr15g0572641 [Helianthus annuus]KAJ0652246.1 hypothetical protein HanOQP8_Chr15g0569981 [Helianthus annuus]
MELLVLTTLDGRMCSITPFRFIGFVMIRLKIWVLGGCCNFTGRHADGSLPVEDFNLELENQSGEKVKLGTKDDQRYN